MADPCAPPLPLRPSGLHFLSFFLFFPASLASFTSFLINHEIPLLRPHLVALQARAAPRVPTPQEFINKNLIKAPRTDKAFFWTGAQNQGNLRRLRPVALQVAEKEGFDIVGEMLQPAARKLIFGFNAEVNKLPKAKQAK
ncbi:hypothetical protein MKEN_00735600 [Mycena kentingensis (nom. inval.)]|nr:hypothetical protein MKEN_00735600 [Mycena kentingensis (nom. inval.)]